MTGFLNRGDFPALLDTLAAHGYAVVGPTVRDGAIVLDTIARVEDLPVGWGDLQEAGTYRLRRRDDDALFGYNLGPWSWKRFLHPPELTLWSARRDGRGFRIVEPARQTPRVAFLGVRACELHAMRIQDRVLKDGPFPDPEYATRRDAALVIAVHCAQSAATCFCASTQTGPRADDGFDLALGETPDGFTVEVGSERGAAIAADLPLRPAPPDAVAAVDAAVREAAARQTRALDTDGLPELLRECAQSPHWESLEERCLACGNCTQVCPTCFCTDVHDTTDLIGDEAHRTRVWDSCFHLDFSRVHGGPVRSTIKARYRHWITHKLSTWVDQFGSSGCVGCGRCIAWCPTGIDIVQEAAALRARRDAREQP